MPERGREGEHGRKGGKMVGIVRNPGADGLPHGLGRAVQLRSPVSPESGHQQCIGSFCAHEPQPKVCTSCEIGFGFRV